MDFTQLIEKYPNEIVSVDGIINEELWNGAKYKILWVLKEAYGEGTGFPEFKDDRLNQYENFKNYSGWIDGFDASNQSGTRIWQNISLINYGILNEFKKMQNSTDLSSEELLKSIKSCALINVKKILGSPVSDYRDLQNHFFKNKDFIFEQIRLINPDVIILPQNVYEYFEQTDKKYTKKENLVQGNNCWAFTFEGKVIVEAYHPSYFGVSKESYVNDIIDVVSKLIVKR